MTTHYLNEIFILNHFLIYEDEFSNIELKIHPYQYEKDEVLE